MLLISLYYTIAFNGNPYSRLLLLLMLNENSVLHRFAIPCFKTMPLSLYFKLLLFDAHAYNHSFQYFVFDSMERIHLNCRSKTRASIFSVRYSCCFFSFLRNVIVYWIDSDIWIHFPNEPNIFQKLFTFHLNLTEALYWIMHS